MKRVFKALFVLGVSVLFFAFGTYAKAIDTADFIISSEGEEYLLSVYSQGTLKPIMQSRDFCELTSYIENSSNTEKNIIFSGIKLRNSVSFEYGKYTFSGEISFSNDANFVIDGADILFKDFSIRFENGLLRLKKGTLEINDSEIYGGNNHAVSLDYSSLAVFKFISGEIYSDSQKASLFLNSGTAYISGGAIINSAGAAVESHSTLVLSKNPALSGSFGIIADTPITLSDFSSSLTLKYLAEFNEGSINTVVYGADEESLTGIRIFDYEAKEYKLTYFKSYRGIDEENFGAVYLPFTVNFYCDNVLIKREQMLSEEIVAPITAVERDGYTFIGWSTDSFSLSPYDFAKKVNKSLNLYAFYALESPYFSISSIQFEYDGEIHKLGFQSIEHPLKENSIITYTWYKDGNIIPVSAEELEVKDVTDSGRYKCKITFTYGTDTVSVTTPEVSVQINKAVITTPNISEKVYNAAPQSPDIMSTSQYTVYSTSGVLVGVYPVKIELNDPQNYRFSDTDDTVKYLDFKIVKAENFWIEDLTASDVYEGQNPSVSAFAAFGTVKYYYSKTYDGIYSEALPFEIGEYYVKACVPESENFYFLTSSPIKFSILKEKILGLAISEMPKKCEYVAFEYFNPAGLVISATFNSGRIEYLQPDKLIFTYQSAESFRFADSAVIASYNGSSIAIPIKVKKAEYDISHIEFSDTEVRFNGKKQTLEYNGAMPLGEDGIYLECSVVGGGINVGSYSVFLEFYTSSKNYVIPERIIAQLKILPYETYVVWSEDNFVYDGSFKCPVAYYTDVFGRKKTPEIDGGGSIAGSYIAVASSTDSNYMLKDSVYGFEVAKADYDISKIVWKSDKFVYDGEIKSVVVDSLPEGMSVIGYIDNQGKNAGRYKAIATVSYDSINYNPPGEIAFEWQIEKRNYDIGGFEFLDNNPTFNTKVHYPIFNGEMPVGIDGIPLSFRFSKGARDVYEGKVLVDITFFTESKNYNVPDALCAYVQVKPLGITVEWNSLEFVYDKTEHVPMAYADECQVSVLGGKVDAGVYTANAVSYDSNYYVVNDTVEFSVRKAENIWINDIAAENIYEGRELSVSADCVSGYVEFHFFSDAEGNFEIDPPKTQGKYYVQARSCNNKNYTDIKTDIVPFEIIKVVPVSLTITVNKEEFSAYTCLSEEDISVLATNNDGSFSYVPFSELTIVYENQESFRVSDKSVKISYNAISANTEVKVVKADFDMNGVSWGVTEFVYDGEEKSVSVSNLPNGLSVKSYIGAVAIAAGSYTAEVIFDYDEENYNPPIFNPCTYTVKKQTIDIPTFDSVIYNGKEHSPISENSLYSIIFTPVKNAGVYTLKLVLTDAENYEFSNLEKECTTTFQITPIKISIKLSDVEKFLFSDITEPEYQVVSGSVIADDSLGLVFVYQEGFVSCYSTNQNYEVDVIKGEIIKRNRLSENGVFTLFVILISIFALILLLIALILRRRDILRYLAIMKYRISPISETVADNPEILPPAPSDVEQKTELPQSIEKQPMDISAEINFPINAEKADGLISDALAKDLVRKGKITIETEGSKKRIINVDTLNNNFSEGAEVDVNKLKENKLIPYDTAYIKILARGIIDKPLKVYANDFSLAAVKMIALTGGEAIKVVTVRKGKRDSLDK